MIKKRATAILLALVMALSLLPVQTLAAETGAAAVDDFMRTPQADVSTDGNTAKADSLSIPDDQLQLATGDPSSTHAHCVCGASHHSIGDHGSEETVTWTAWNETSTLPTTAGNYYLTQDVTLTEMAKVGANIALCLNGCTIAAKGNFDVIQIWGSGASLTITDCKGSGLITHESGAGCGVANFAGFKMYGGIIKDNIRNDNNEGAGVENGSGGTFRMYGGSIATNKANNASGGGVSNAGTFRMCGGSITGNKASLYGGGVWNNGSMKIEGEVVIADNKNMIETKASNLYLCNGKELEIVGNLATGSKIGISTQRTDYPVVFSFTYEKDYSNYFAADAANVKVVYDSSTKQLRLEKETIASKYTVTVNVDGNGTASASSDTAAESDEITLTAIPTAGYHFKEWQVVRGGVTITDNKFTMPAGNVAVTAVFEAHSFTLENKDAQYLKSAADCTNDAVYYKSCSCGEASDTLTFTANGTALNHDYGAWTSNGNGTHSRTCSRDASHIETVDCSGGTATCKDQATCEVCGEKYGDKNPANHTGTTEWVCTAEKHTRKYGCCGMITVAEAAHDWADGVCTVCRYSCTHSGGTATCKDKAVCAVCGAAYGALDTNNHVGGTELKNAKSATCTEKGYTGDTYCKSCGIKVSDGKDIPSAGHDLKHVDAKRSTTRTEGNSEYWYCDSCGKYFRDAAAAKEITRADTVIAKRSGNSGSSGTTSGTTSNTGKDTVKSSDTGDAGIALYGAMALLSLSGGAWLTGKKRK